MSSLLQPATIGATLHLRNRIIMSSMTRNRNTENLTPGPASVEYYSQRATAGLIVTEGVFPSPLLTPWPYAPVMCDEEHAAAWANVVDAVHAKGGKIFMQAWHVGKSCDLDGDGVKKAVESFRRAAELAKAAGFDGIEVLAQGGYLIHSFLCSHLNNRKDNYGGSTENRCRFAFEVIETIASVFSYDRIGVKICPTDFMGDSMITHQEMSEVYSHLINQVVARGLAYINLSRRGVDLSRGGERYVPLSVRPADKALETGYEPLNEFGPLIKFAGSKTALMVNEEYTSDEAERLVEEGKIDLIAFGRPFICNPDLIHRVESRIPFAKNERSRSVHYGRAGEPRVHFTDWPTA